jgi:hypothetical protein
MKCAAGGTLVQNIPIENKEENKDMDVSVTLKEGTENGDWFSCPSHLKIRLGDTSKHQFPITFRPKF